MNTNGIAYHFHTAKHYVQSLFKGKGSVASTDFHQKPKEETFDFDLIGHYFMFRDRSDALQTISKQTINDIDFAELFSFADRTYSKIGQQYLFNKLLTINKEISFDRQECLISYYQANKELRTNVQQLISRLNKQEAYYISSLFLDGYISKPGWFWLVYASSLTSILTFGLAFIYHQLFLLLLFLLIVNMIIHIWNKNNIFMYMDSIPQLPVLCDIAEQIRKLNVAEPPPPNVDNAIKSIGGLKRKLWFFKLNTKTNSEVEALLLFVWEHIKVLFLIEPIVVFQTLKELSEKKNDIRELYEYVGEVDSFLSIAALRESLDSYCVPTIDTANHKTLAFTHIYHPLVANCIPNSLTMAGKSVLLTGSNMAGKTTFIRMVAVNVLFAQTINTCFAKQFRLSPMRLFSAIRIADDLLNDKSYYFEEVETIKGMLAESRSSSANLFLLDEIFKGTNTTERIAAGKAVLSYLSQWDRNIVFVSTHDIELTGMLNDTYELYHFTETVKDSQVHFDYKLKSGNLATRNAIRILEISGYPLEVVEEARRIANMDKLQPS